MDQNQLASRLIYLPLFIEEKIHLWLTFKSLKPGSLIVLQREKGNLNKTHIDRIYKWLNDAGLRYKLDTNSKKDKVHLIVSKDNNIIDKITTYKVPLSKKGQYQLGILLGYPSKAAEAYGYQYSTLINEGDIDSHIKNLPEYRYLSYRVRQGHEIEDLQTAKHWMNVIRKDIPKLAKWYENLEVRSLADKKQKSRTNNNPGIG